MEVSGQLHAPAALAPGKELLGTDGGWIFMATQNCSRQVLYPPPQTSRNHKPIFTHGLQRLLLCLEVLVGLFQVLLCGLQVLLQLSPPLLQVSDVLKDLEQINHADIINGF